MTAVALVEKQESYSFIVGNKKYGGFYLQSSWNNFTKYEHENLKDSFGRKQCVIFFDPIPGNKTQTIVYTTVPGVYSLVYPEVEGGNDSV